MQLNYQTEPKENSKMLLSITIDKSEIKKTYDELLLDAQKNAAIDGFRKGKVPTSILELKYKQGFLAETANKVIDEAYKEVYDKLEKKPLAYSMPSLEEFKMPVLGDDFKVELIFDIFPEYKIGEYKGVEVTKDDVLITDEDVNKEIDRYLHDFATIEAKESKIEEKDIAYIDCVVTQDGNEVYKKEGEYIHIGKDYDMYKIGKDLIGLKKGDEKEFTKKYSKDEIESLKEKTFKFKVKINEVKREVFPELNDELAKQINEECKTVDELKNKIKTDLDEFSKNVVKNRAVNQIIKGLISTYEGPIPESMISQQLEAFYNELVQKFRGDEKRVQSMLKRDGLTKETYNEKMKDKAVEEIKRGLILSEVVKKEEIKVSEEDVKKHIEPYSKYYKMDAEKLYETFKNAGNLKMFENEIEAKKAVDFLFDNAKSKKGKKLSLEELSKIVEEESKIEEKI
jgi:trigger factor